MLVNGCVAGDARGERDYKDGEKTTPEGRWPLRRVKRATQGTVMVVPSPVAVMENVPAVLDT
jgi:hypothetical protein